MSNLYSSNNPFPDPHYFVGFDVAQVNDYSAVAVVEHRHVAAGRSNFISSGDILVRRSIRHLHRFPLGMPYPDIAAEVRALIRRPELGRRVDLVADATGVGGPVIDLLRRPPLGCPLFPVVITGSGAESRHAGHHSVPKENLIAGLLVLFQNGELSIASGLPEAKTLVHELGNMRVKMSANGHARYGVWRTGEHDDLVMATALACWRGLSVHPLNLVQSSGGK